MGFLDDGYTREYLRRQNGPQNWKLMMCKAGVCSIALLFLRESHHKAIARAQTDGESRSWHIHQTLQPKGLSTVYSNVSKAFLASCKVTFGRLSVVLVLLLSFIHNGTINMILSSLGFVFQRQYQFSPVVAGLAYLGLGLGGLASLAAANYLNRCWKSRLQQRDYEAGISSLPPLLLSFPLAAGSLVWYGWCCERKIHWIVPILSLWFFGYSYMSIVVRIIPHSMFRVLTYTKLASRVFLVDTVAEYPASALAAHTVASSIGGALLPLATFPIYNDIGYGWGNTLIAGISMSLVSIPIVLLHQAGRI